MNKEKLYYEKECLICMEKKEISTLCIVCSICFNCYTQYLKTKFDNDFSNSFSQINCPNHNCDSVFNMDSFYLHFEKENIVAIEEVLFNKYLNFTGKNIVKCPRKGCNYTAFLLDEDYQCSTFHCDICQDTWKNSLFIYKYSSEYIRNELSELLIKITCVSCPFCQVNIYKSHGCDHMKCGRCNIDFCYTCLKSYKDHERDIKDCYFKQLMLGFIRYTIIISCFLKIMLSFSITRFMLYVIFYCVLINFFFVNIVMIAYILVLIILAIITITPNFKIFCFNRITRFHTISLLIILISSHCYLYLKINFIYYYTNFLMKETLFVILLGIGVAFLYFMVLLIFIFFRRTKQIN